MAKKRIPTKPLLLSDLQRAVLLLIGHTDRATVHGLLRQLPALGHQVRQTVLEQLLEELTDWNFCASYPSTDRQGRTRYLRLTILGREAVATPTAQIEL